MTSKIKLQNFDGPLDLLLQLIEGEELNITEISLSQVTEQYFQYLDKLEKNVDSKLADFLVIATKLVYLKSRQLLPYLYTEDEETGPTLADQLKMYKAYIDASKNIEFLWQNKDLSYGRVEPMRKSEEFCPPDNIRIENLHESFTRLLKRLKPVLPLEKETIDHTISIKQTVDRIRHLLGTGKKFSFKNLMSKARDRSEVIVSFLALLELLRKKDIIVRQQNVFGDLEVKKI